jgi:hypothetical protein
MKVFVEAGKVIVDGEEASVYIPKGQSLNAGVELRNFKFQNVHEGKFDKVFEDVRVSDRKGYEHSIRLSILNGSLLGKSLNGNDLLPGDILTPKSARGLAAALIACADFTETKGG